MLKGPHPLLALLLLAACGQNQAQSGGTAPVGIALKLPAATSASAGAARTAAFRTSAGTVAKINISVADANNIILVSVSIDVASDVKELTVDLNVPAGFSRTFIVEAFDAKGTVLYRGRSAATDLVVGVPKSVTIQLVEVAPIEVTVSPTAATVKTLGSQNFAATVSGTDDKSVTWSIALPEGLITDSALGELVQTGPATATYTAPNVVPGVNPILVVATSVADPAKSKSAFVTVVNNIVFVDAVQGIDSPDCGAIASPCRSMTKGIAAAAAGDVVSVGQGRYDEAVETFPIQMKPGVQLAGAGPGKSTITWNQFNNFPAAVVMAENSSISGFTLDANNNRVPALVEVDSGSPVILNNAFTDGFKNGVTGIDVTGGSPLITSNTFSYFGHSDAPSAAIEIYNDADPIVFQNTITNNRLGLLSASASGGILSKNDVRFNHIGVQVEPQSRPNLGDGTAGHPGQNILSCNASADLADYNDSPAVSARNNLWDHVPPTQSSVIGNGIDIYATEPDRVDSAGAQLAPPCAVTITLPVIGSFVRGTVDIQANASDPSGIRQVDFYRDSVDPDHLIGSVSEPISGVYEFFWETLSGQIQDGRHDLIAVATNGENGQLFSAPVGVTLDNTPPVPVLNSPKPYQIFTGTVLFDVSPGDANPDRVEFTVTDDAGKKVFTGQGVPDASGNYVLSWDPPRGTDDKLRVTATVFDKAGNSGSVENPFIVKCP